MRWLVGIGKFMRPYLHNHSQEYQCEWTIPLNNCLLYWYFQQHQHCKNVLHNLRSLAWALIIVGPQATPQRAHALRLVQRYHLVGSSWLLVSLLNKCETLNSHKIVWKKIFSIFLSAYCFCTLNILLASSNAPLDADVSIWVPEKLY